MLKMKLENSTRLVTLASLAFGQSLSLQNAARGELSLSRRGYLQQAFHHDP